MSSIEIIETYPRLVDFVLSDHVLVHVLYTHLTNAISNNTKLAGKLSNAIALLVRQHSQAEMDVLYPAMKQDLGPMGESLYKQAIQEHAEIEELVQEAIKAGIGSMDAAKIVKKLCDAFFVHAETEEKDMVPALIAKENEAKQLQIVESMIKSKSNAPFEPQIPKEV